MKSCAAAEIMNAAAKTRVVVTRMITARTRMLNGLRADSAKPAVKPQ
jgi:hypothetical protein